jgi:hypothetical protein
VNGFFPFPAQFKHTTVAVINVPQLVNQMMSKCSSRGKMLRTTVITALAFSANVVCAQPVRFQQLICPVTTRLQVVQQNSAISSGGRFCVLYLFFKRL